MSHPDAETLMRYAEGILKREDVEQVASHIESCQECRETESSMQAFGARLDSEWLGARLRTIFPQELNCPHAAELAEYSLDETAPADRERIGGHLAGCFRCRDALGEMEQGAAALVRADPLEVRTAGSAESWRDRLRAALDLVPGPAWAGAAAAVGVVFVAGLLLRPVLIGPSLPVPLAEGYRIAKPPLIPSAAVSAFGIAPPMKPESDQRFREAMASHAEPDFAEKAIPKLEAAVAIDPRNEQAQFWLGIARLLKDEVRSAIPPLEAAVKLAPGRLEYRQYLVWAYLRMDRNADALRVQTELLERR